jgi:hypothetical protein
VEDHVLVQIEDTEMQMAKFKNKKDEHDKSQQKGNEFSSKN